MSYRFFFSFVNNFVVWYSLHICILLWLVLSLLQWWFCVCQAYTFPKPDTVILEDEFVQYFIPFIPFCPFSTTMLYIFTNCCTAMMHVPLTYAEESSAALWPTWSSSLGVCGSQYIFFPPGAASVLPRHQFPQCCCWHHAVYHRLPGDHGGKQIFTKQSQVNLISNCSLPGGLGSAPWVPSREGGSGQPDPNQIPALPARCAHRLNTHHSCLCFWGVCACVRNDTTFIFVPFFFFLHH